MLSSDGAGDECAECSIGLGGGPRARKRDLCPFGGDGTPFSIVSFAFNVEPSLRPSRNEEAMPMSVVSGLGRPH